MPSDTWFYVQNKQKVGPVSKEKVRSLFEQGAIAGTDLVWTQGMSEWKPASQVQARFSPPVAAASPAVPAPPSLGGGLEPAIDMGTPATAGKPAPAYDVGEGLGIERTYAPSTDREYAHIGLRFVAMIIDGFILIPLLAIVFIPGVMVLAMFTTTDELGQQVLSPLGNLAGLGINLLLVAVQWLYFARQESGIKMATIGKRVMGIQVIDIDGYPVSFLRATGRYFAKIISWIPCMIGYLFPLFTPKKQALHDMIAGTLVVKAR